MAKKKAGSGAPLAKTAPVLSAVEREARAMLDSNDNGEIDNVFDIVDELTSIEERLPANSQLREEWDPFHEECIQIMVEASSK